MRQSTCLEALVIFLSCRSRVFLYLWWSTVLGVFSGGCGGRPQGASAGGGCPQGVNLVKGLILTTLKLCFLFLFKKKQRRLRID